jgi:LmeA-like phospholipid-binding
MRRGSGPRRSRLALFLAGGAVLLLGLAQLFLPRIAASRISSRLGRYGSVQSVHVKAWPAVKLLWGSADSVTVRARRLSLNPAQTAKLLWEARSLDRITMTAESVREGPLGLSDVSFTKQGPALSAQARMAAADVRSALPEGADVQLLSSEGGEVKVRAVGGLFGVRTSLDAVAAASEGRLVVHPLAGLLSGLRLTLFSDPHVYVQAVGASVEPSKPPSYLLTMRASLR